MTPLFDQIEETIPEIPGWCSYRKGQHLAAMVIALSARTTIELGVFGGRGVLSMALAHKHTGSGMAIAIDPWTNAAATEGYTGANLEWWQTLNLEGIYNGFQSNVDKLGCRNVIRVERMKSLEFNPPASIDLLHADSQHTDATSAEMQRYAPFVRIGGIIVLDDMTWVNNGNACVSAASGWLLKHGFTELCRVFRDVKGEDKDDYAVYQKIK